MAIYTAEILWARSDQKFTDNRYSRQHTLRFDSGIEIAGSSSPHVVPLPYSVVDAVDPEEAFVNVFTQRGIGISRPERTTSGKDWYAFRITRTSARR
jgi:hypothetical protein